MMRQLDLALAKKSTEQLDKDMEVCFDALPKNTAAVSLPTLIYLQQLEIAFLRVQIEILRREINELRNGGDNGNGR